MSTSKYNIITFLPKNLFEQFQRLANAYFLVLLILQLIPQVSSLNPITTILPLACVIILKGVKDLIDDIVGLSIRLYSYIVLHIFISCLTKARHRNDNAVNSRATYVLRGKHLRKEKWCHIMVGDIIKLKCDEFVAVSSRQCFDRCDKSLTYECIEYYKG